MFPRLRRLRVSRFSFSLRLSFFFMGFSSIGEGASSAWLHRHFVDIAPDPVFPRLQRLDQRVALPVKVLRRVLVLRGVAAAHVTTGETKPQVDPRVARLQALLAPLGVGFDVVDLIEVGTDHRVLSMASSSRIGTGPSEYTNWEEAAATSREVASPSAEVLTS
jgi:hypothetical protein